MKYLFKFLMMFIVYNGFAQGGQNGKNKNVITFPNGDESITIIENQDKNIIQLTSSEPENEYDMLDLSNHEAAHRLAKKRGIIKQVGTDQIDDRYVIGRREEDSSEEEGQEDQDSSGA